MTFMCIYIPGGLMAHVEACVYRFQL